MCYLSELSGGIIIYSLLTYALWAASSCGIMQLKKRSEFCFWPVLIINDHKSALDSQASSLYPRACVALDNHLGLDFPLASQEELVLQQTLPVVPINKTLWSDRTINE